jgi:flagellar biosynthetic protein FliR
VDLVGYGLGQVQVWLLFLLRAGGFVFVAPLFSSRLGPPQFRIAMGAMLATIAFLAWSPTLHLPADGGLAWFVPAALSEVALGLMLGFAVGLVLVAFQFAGQLIGYQMGFAIVNVLDPHSQNQISLVGEFLFAVVMLCFLSLNLHHDLLGLWYQSYSVAPPGGFSFEQLAAPGSPFLPALTRTCTDMFYLALKIAMPLLAFLLLSDLALGIVARIMPQMNVFIVGIPLKIAVGLFFLSLVLLQFDPLVRHCVMRFINHTGELMASLAT